MAYTKGITRPLCIFLCHSSGDKNAVRELYRRLCAEGFDPWLDEEKLLPGQDWQQEILKAVRDSDVVIVCLSHRAVDKAGYIQKEIKYALDVADEQPESSIFIIPLKFEECDVPERLRRWHWANYFEDGGYKRLVQALHKVQEGASQESPEVTFEEAYQEWKIKEFLPGETKVTYILNNIKDISLDIDTCEFLLRSSMSIYHHDLKEKLSNINTQILFEASKRLLGKRENHYTKWRGIRYLVFADPKKAEVCLWNIYKNYDEDLSIRVEAFGRLWKCESEKGIDESYSIALKEPKWQLRQAAIKNIGHGKIRNDTSKILKEALRDKRWEVRAEVAYAIVRLRLGSLAPDMVNAIENERSRKGLNRLLYCLWNFNSHSSVKEFMKKHEDEIPKWFYKTPDFHAIWEDTVDDLL